MRQRLAIAAALLRPRDLLMLDEPTNGLDPQGTREVRSLIGELAADGTTVLVSTHLLSEVEQICTHVGVMHLGRLVAQGDLAALRAGAVPRARSARGPTPPGAARAGPVRCGCRRHGHRLLGAVAPEKVAPRGARGRARAGFVFRADLEELFVSLTGEGFDVSG